MKLELIGDDGQVRAGVQLPSMPKRTNWTDRDYVALIEWHSQMQDQASHLLAYLVLDNLNAADVSLLMKGRT